VIGALYALAQGEGASVAEAIDGITTSRKADVIAFCSPVSDQRGLADSRPAHWFFDDDEKHYGSKDPTRSPRGTWRLSR